MQSEALTARVNLPGVLIQSEGRAARVDMSWGSDTVRNPGGECGIAKLQI